MASGKDLEAQAGTQPNLDNAYLEKETETGPSSQNSSYHRNQDEFAKEDSEKNRSTDGRDDSSEPGVSLDEIEQAPAAPSVSSRKSRICRIFGRTSSRKRERGLPPVIIPVSDLDHGIVGWDNQDDPDMPLNFAESRKWAIIWGITTITVMTPFASSVLAPAIAVLNKDFENDNLTIGTLPVSIYILGFSIGPLFLSPLSEIYGRAPVFSASNIFFCFWLLGSGLAPNLASLIVMRFLTGVGGSACITLGAGIIADLFPVEQRGRALAVWTTGPILGPTIGPVAGGFIAETIGWRWDFWITLIPSALMTICMIIFLKETNHKVLMQRKVVRLRVESGREDLISCYETGASLAQSKSAIILNGLLRPAKMLFLSPLIFFSSLYIAFASGVLYMLYNTVPMVFVGTYGWSTGASGLAILSLGIGYFVGLITFAHTSDSTVVRLTKANNGVFEPEMRLVTCVFYACLLPITFFWYGWSAEYKTHWIVPLLGLFPFGFALLGVWQPTQAYIIDSYPQYAASGVGAFTVLRSTITAFLPLAGPRMYEVLGLGWGNSLLGLICIVMIPIPLVICKTGGRLRKRQKLKL